MLQIETYWAPAKWGGNSGWEFEDILKPTKPACSSSDALNIPKAYFNEGKMQITPFVQAGEQGFYVWSGVSRDLSDYTKKAGQDLVLTLSTEDFRINKQKKKNLIEIVGFIFERKDQP